MGPLASFSPAACRLLIAHGLGEKRGDFGISARPCAARFALSSPSSRSGAVHDPASSPPAHRFPFVRGHRIYGKTAAPVRDLKGLRLTPDAALADAPPLDVLHIPGGRGQEALMDDEEVLAWIRQQAAGACSIFSVCTGALVCGAAGLLKGRRATTHWASFHLLPYFGAIPVNERVVVDGAWVFAAGVTAGIDGALRLAASCAATRPRRRSNCIWFMRRSHRLTAARPRRRHPRYSSKRGNPCASSRRGGKKPRDGWPPNSAFPFRPR